MNSIYFEHERGQTLGLWVLASNIGFAVGPLSTQTPKSCWPFSCVFVLGIDLLSAAGWYISHVDQYWVAWLTAILFGILLLLEVFFLPETLYPRKHILSQILSDQSSRSNNRNEIGIIRTKKLPFFNFKKIPGIAHPKPWDGLWSFLTLWTFPNVSIIVFSYCFSW